MTCICCGETNLALLAGPGTEMFCFNCHPKHHDGKRCPAWEEHSGMKHWRELVQFMQDDQVIPVVSPHPDVMPTSISIKHHGHPGSTDAAKTPFTKKQLDEIRESRRQGDPAAPRLEDVGHHGSVLDAEIKVFNERRAEWLKENKGKWAVVKCPGHDGYVAILCDTFEAAAKRGYEDFGHNLPFLIRQVLEKDPVINLPTVFIAKDVPGVSSNRDLPLPTLDATGMQPGEFRTGKVSFEVRQVDRETSSPLKPGGTT